MKPEFGRIDAPWWDDGRATIVVGTGPSLIGFDFNRLRSLGHILAVKEAWRDLPFADACFGLDIPWMQWGRLGLAELAKRMPLYLAVPDQELAHDPIEGATYLKRIRKCERLSEEPDTIEAGGNSGFGAFNLAFLKRAKRIVLLGFDYAGQHYCHDRYEPRPLDHNVRYMPNWATNFRQTLPQLKRDGVEVTNASPSSLVDAFPKCSLDQAIEALHA